MAGSSLYFDIIKDYGENMFCGSYLIVNIMQAGTTTIFNPATVGSRRGGETCGYLSTRVAG